ncbi:M15 family metallopeptidase [Synechococcus phage MinM1]|nr:M15 family metallopeptidase [Synechococcus phage MinM1]
MNLLRRLLGFGAARREAPPEPPAPPPAPPAVPVHVVGSPAAMPPAPALLTGGAVGLTPRDMDRLRGVHPDLVRVVIRARSMEPLFVIEGLRTPERQRELVARGASRTQNSRHLTGHAVDLGPVPLDWDDKAAFRRLAGAMKRAADDEGVALVWGGDWRSFYDGPHFELDRRKYPA